MKKILIWVSDESLKKVSMVVNEVNSDICILSVKTQKEANSVIRVCLFLNFYTAILCTCNGKRSHCSNRRWFYG